ncbi:serine/threonine-protein kinase [Nocardia sp. NPDC019395]|uniref:serine/threonine-protein kinase n=1 Tax=Nocardia sp. NPDC019395 TaxID=3154686 RepID=UPI0033DEB066
MPLPLGAVVGGYRILRVLGSGGMGSVYLGQHPSLPRQDAVKVLNEQLSTDREFRARFEREGRLAAGLDHPNIVSVYNRGAEDGRLWIAMQYVPGTDAARESPQGSTTMHPLRALHIISEVGKGLDYAHYRRLLHRDVKPANFLLSRAGGEAGERVLLADFGVAKSTEDDQDLTATGKFVATVAYASPEQLLGQPLDHRSDIYSLGCSFYRLLTGRNPYPSAVPAVVLMGHVHEPPPRVTSIRHDIAPEFDNVLAKALAKSPYDRYNSCQEFVRDAEAALLGRMQYRAPEGGPLPQGGPFPVSPPAGTGNPPYLFARHSEESTGADHRRTGPDPEVRDRPGNSRTWRRMLIAFAVPIVVALAVVVGVVLVSSAGSKDAGALAAVRSQHPEFSGKVVAAFNYDPGRVHGGPPLTAILAGSPQAEFLSDIGFRYADAYRPDGDEESPRTLPIASFRVAEPVDVVIVLRSDGQSGWGGLPEGLAKAPARLVVTGDEPSVGAFREWSADSAADLIDGVVPKISETLT